ncbi:MAG TPA: alkaline phosphatase family protein [Candidatus Cybelea sp.]
MSLRFAAVASFAAVLAGCGGTATGALAPFSRMPPHAQQSSPIAHVVVIVQENRSFDNLFATFPGADGTTMGLEKVREGGKYVVKSIALHQSALVMNTDIGHCRYSFVTAKDGGKMDAFNLEPKGVCPRGSSGGGPTIGTIAYQYVNPKQIAPYWDLAKQYVLGDHLFQTQGSGSFTAHQDLIRGNTQIAVGKSLVDTPTGMPWGCDSSKTARTDLLTSELKFEEDKGPRPCTTNFPSMGSAYATLRDLLDAKGVSWKYYSPCFVASPGCGNGCTQCAGALLNAFDVIAPVRNGSEWGTNVSMPQTKIFDDISNGTLPAVAWVIPTNNDSDHPGTLVDRGPQWVASIVNAIGKSAYWKSSAIVVVWDDWGGLYDHVKPPLLDEKGGLGFRVPLLVVSPYVPKGAISHTRYEFGSILKYIEQNWALGSLKTTDQRSTSILNVFNYKQSPRAFTPIPSQLSPEFFRREPPSDGGDPE